MESTIKNDKDNNKGVEDDGESKTQKQTDINPDSVQSQDVTQQNVQMPQGGSSREEINEPPLASDFKTVLRIEHPKAENGYLKKESKEQEDSNELKTEKKNGQEAINNQGTLTEQAAVPDVQQDWHAEMCTEFILGVLKSTANEEDTSVIIKKIDSKKIPESTGFYLICWESSPSDPTKNYPIFVGVATNFKTVLSGLKWKKVGPEKKTVKLEDILEHVTYNGNKIQAQASQLKVYMLKLTYAASKFLKESFLEEFDFCLNKRMNTKTRMSIDISSQKTPTEVAAQIKKKGTWEKGIKQCRSMAFGK